MVPGIMAAAPATGATESVRAKGIDGTVPRVCPSDTPVGMAFMTNQAAVFTPPLMAIKDERGAEEPSIEYRRPVLVNGDGGSAATKGAAEIGAANAWAVPLAAPPATAAAVHGRGGRVGGRRQRR